MSIFRYLAVSHLFNAFAPRFFSSPFIWVEIRDSPALGITKCQQLYKLSVAPGWFSEGILPVGKPVEREDGKFILLIIVLLVEDGNVAVI